MLTIDATKLATGMDETTRERKLKELLADDDKPAPAAAPAPPVAPAAPAAPQK
jgi:hypothetical protein